MKELRGKEDTANRNTGPMKIKVETHARERNGSLYLMIQNGSKLIPGTHLVQVLVSVLLEKKIPSDR